MHWPLTCTYYTYIILTITSPSSSHRSPPPLLADPTKFTPKQGLTDDPDPTMKAANLIMDETEMTAAVRFKDLEKYQKAAFTIWCMQSKVKGYMAALWVRSFPSLFIDHPLQMSKLLMSIEDIKDNTGFLDHAKQQLDLTAASGKSAFLRNLQRLVKTIEYRISTFPDTEGGNINKDKLKKDMRRMGSQLILLSLHIHQKLEQKNIRDKKLIDTILEQAILLPSKAFVAFKGAQLNSMSQFVRGPQLQLKFLKDWGLPIHIQGEHIIVGGQEVLPHCVAQKIRHEEEDESGESTLGILKSIRRVPTDQELVLMPSDHKNHPQKDCWAAYCGICLAWCKQKRLTGDLFYKHAQLGTLNAALKLCPYKIMNSIDNHPFHILLEKLGMFGEITPAVQLQEPAELLAALDNDSDSDDENDILQQVAKRQRTSLGGGASSAAPADNSSDPQVSLSDDCDVLYTQVMLPNELKQEWEQAIVERRFIFPDASRGEI